MLENYIYVLLDASDSMRSIHHPTVDAFNGIIDGIRSNAKTKKQRTLISLRTFSDEPHNALMFNVKAEELKPLTYDQYRVGGMTKLFGSVKVCIEELDPFNTGKGDKSFTVIAITDGDDNRSFGLTRTVIEMMEVRQENWTFAFQVPKGNKAGFVRQFKIPVYNVNEWEATAAGAAIMANETKAALDNYYDDRAAGKKASKTFFVKPDLSGVDVKKELDDMAGQYRVLTVGPHPYNQVWHIRDFIEQLGMTFENGNGFYQLIKPEKVQDYKQVLIMDGRKIYGGPEARDLIGLPKNSEAKVTPGNHDKYLIFIQSTSHNARKLPHGTKLLVKK